MLQGGGDISRPQQRDQALKRLEANTGCQRFPNLEWYAYGSFASSEEPQPTLPHFHLSALSAAHGRPTAFIHVGTHKTGTTSLQESLAVNNDLLREVGIFIPPAGRRSDRGGHHNLAWELNGDPRFEARYGTFAQALNEIMAAGAPVVCLSSEDFEYLHDKPAALRRMRDGFRSAGYEAVIVVYLRPQAGYAESLYAELVKHGFARSFYDYLASILREGALTFERGWRFAFDYERLVAKFAEVFGAGRIVVRSYTGAVAGHTLTSDFLRTIGAGSTVESGRLRQVPRLNATRPFVDVVQQYYENIAATSAQQAVRLYADRAYQSRFDPVHLPEVELIARRFAAGNQRIYRHYGTAIPYVSRSDLLRDVVAAVGFDAAAEKRRRLLRAQSVGGESPRPLLPRPSYGR